MPCRSMPAVSNSASRTAIEARAAARPMVEIRQLGKSYGALTVLRGVSLTIGEGEAVAVIGPSGSGKTTLLRCIDLLEEFEEGEIVFDGDPIGYRGGLSGRRQRLPERTI